MRAPCLARLSLLPLLAALACSAAGGTDDVGGEDSDTDAGTGPSGPGSTLDSGLTGDGSLDPDSACAATRRKAEPAPLDLYLMLDMTGSMINPAGDGGIEKRADALRAGMKNFLSSPDSEGIGAAAQKFPVMIGQNESCDPADYATPAIPWSLLPNPALVDWIGQISAQGYTPTVAALQGAVDGCIARMTEEPEHSCAVVFVTDGHPEGDCQPTEEDAKPHVGAIASYASDHGVLVFAVGFPGIDALGEEVLQIAASAGGTDVPHIISATGDVSDAFVQALEDIRNDAMGCEFKIPSSDEGQVNPNLVSVTYTASDTGLEEEIPRVDTGADCGVGEGWYYNDAAHPTRLILCPATCARVEADLEGEVEVLLGCTPVQR